MTNTKILKELVTASDTTIAGKILRTKYPNPKIITFMFEENFIQKGEKDGKKN